MGLEKKPSGLPLAALKRYIAGISADSPRIMRGVDQPTGSGRSSLVSFRGVLWAATSVMIFAGWFIVTRFSLADELRVWDFTALRFGIGALLLSPALFTGRHPLPRGAWLEGLLFAFLWGAPFALLVALGLQLTSAAQAASIMPTLMPVFSGLIAWFVLGHTQGWRRLCGYTAIIAGLVGLTSANSLSQGPPNLAGVASLILAAAMWAVYTLRFRRSGLTPLQAAALICFWSALLFLPIYLLLGLSRLGHTSMQEFTFQAAYQGVLMTVVATVAFNRAVALLGPGAATAIIALLPVVASAMAIPILGEVPTTIDGLAIGVIVVGVILTALPVPRQENSEVIPP